MCFKSTTTLIFAKQTILNFEIREKVLNQIVIIQFYDGENFFYRQQQKNQLHH